MYGLTEFVLSSDQTISIDLHETTKGNLQSILRSKEIDGISVDAVEKGQTIVRRPCDEE